MNIFTFAQDILQALIRIDTRSALAKEVQAASYLQGILSSHGIVSSIFEPSPGKGNLVAHYPGEVEESIVLSCHLDTAEFFPEEWSLHPLSAAMNHGRIYGRGAIDCKGLCALWCAILCAWSTSGYRPYYSLILVASADEESGGEEGVAWLFRETTIFSHSILVLGEGGGFELDRSNHSVLTIQTCEMSTFPLKRHFPIADYRPEEVIERGVEAGYFPGMSAADYLAMRSYERKVDFKQLLPSISQAGGRIQLHIPPFLSPGEIGAQKSILEEEGTGNQKAKLLYYAGIAQYLKQNHQISLLPVMTPGYSDNRLFRSAGIETYGFFPVFLTNSIAGIHGKDEYICREGLRRAVSVLQGLLQHISQNKQPQTKFCE